MRLTFLSRVPLWVLTERSNLRGMLLSFLVVSLLRLISSQKVPPAYVESYLNPQPEKLVLRDFQDLLPTDLERTGQDLNVVLAVGIVFPGTIILYDHWEDGFEMDIREPSQSTTLIFGDGDLATGFHPTFLTDLFEVTDSLVLVEQFVNASNDRDPAMIMYDARDRLWSTLPVVVVKAGYPTHAGAIQAGAFEIYPEGQFAGTHFRVGLGGGHASEQVPAGTQIACGLPGGSECTYIRYPLDDKLNQTQHLLHGFNVRIDFDSCERAFEEKYGSYSLVGAYTILEEDNTTVCHKRNNTTLSCFQGDEGETVRYDVLVNDELVATKNVAVSLFTGQIDESTGYQVRWMTLPPLNELETEWWTPVFSDLIAADSGCTRSPYNIFVLVYNPDQLNDITVNFTQDPAQGAATYLVPAKKTAVIRLSNGVKYSARVQCSADCIPFLQHDNWIRSDWGHTLIPASRLQPEAVVALGWGAVPSNDCLSNASSACVIQNPTYLPLWISATEAADVFIDEDGDLLPEATYALAAQQAVSYYGTLYADLSGTKVYTNSTTAKVIVAWGQQFDGGLRSPDCGTSIYPVQPLQVRQDTFFGDDCSSVGNLIKITTSFGRPIPANYFQITTDLGSYRGSEFVSRSTEYVITKLDGTEVISPVPDSLFGTPFPLDNGGIGNLEILPGEWHAVRWNMTWNCSALKPADDVTFFMDSGPNCSVSSGDAHLNDVSDTPNDFFSKYAAGTSGNLTIPRTSRPTHDIGVTVQALGDGGTFTVYADGRWVFTPASAAANGCIYNSYIGYTICYDEVYDEVLCGSATISVISPTLNASHDYNRTPRSEQILEGPSVLLNDQANSPIQVTAFSGPAAQANTTNDPSGPTVPGTNGGIFKLLPNGRYSFDPTGLPDSVFPTDGSRFLTSVNYTVCITGFTLCRQATLTVEVLYVVAEDDFDSTTWPTRVLVGTVSSNDYGTGGVTEVAKVVDRLTGTVHSIASGNPSVPVTGDNGGTFVLYSNGTYVFGSSTVDPKDFPSDGSPLVTRVNYTACLPAPDGATCDPAVLSITVTYSISASDDSNKTPRTVPILPAASTSVLSNDSGSGPLSVMTFGGVNATNDPSGPAVPGTNGGIFKLLPNGRYSFDPTGLPDSVFPTDGSRFLTSVNYTVCITGANPPSPLCRQATLTVEVLYVVAEDDFDSTTWPTGVLVGTVSSNDYGTGGVTEVAKVVDRLTGTVHSIASGNPSVPVTGDNGGTFVLYSNGTYVFDASTVDPKDFPSDGSPLVTRVNYTACLPAPDGATCDPAVLSITVSYSISASDDSNKTPRTVPILPAASTSVLSNDSGSGPLSVMTFGGVNATNDPSGPAVPGTNGGIFKLLPNGRYSFDPTGLPDSVFPTDGSRFLTSVNYTVCITGANPPSPLCRQATLTVEVLYVVAEDDFDSTTWPTGVLVGTVSSNDYGTGGVTEVAKVVDRLTGTVHSIASGNPSVPVTGDNGGTFVLYSNGTYVFDASTVDPKDFPSDGSPLVTRVNYTACLPAPDGATCDPAVLSITVTYSISASDDSNKTPRTVPILPAASTSVLSNDSGSGPLSVMTFGGVNATNDPSGPAVPGTNGGIFKLLPNGRYSFDPTGLPDSVFPTDGSRFLTSVNYTVCITGANPPSPLCRQATLTVEVLYVVAEDDFDSTTWPTGVLVGTVSSNDYGTGGVTEVAKVVDRLTGTVHSIASGNPSVPVTGDNGGTFVLYSNGTYVFDASTVDPKDFPSDGSPLVTRVNYTACLPAPDGATCDPAVLSITVTYSISASDDSNKTPRTVPILPAASTSVLSNDSGSGPLSVMTFGGVNATNDPSGPAVPGTNGGIFKLLPNGRYSFDPTGLPDSVFPTDGSRFLTSVNYTVCITGANPPSPLCRQATLTVEVLYVVAEDDFDSTTWPTGVLMGTVSSNDYGTGGVTEVAKVVDRLTGTVHSIASGNPSVPVTGDNGGTFVLYSNGTYVFDASTVDPKDFPSDGSPLVTRVNYTACLPAPDGATCDPAVLSITVTYSISASDDSNKTPRTVPILPAASTSVLSNDSGSGPLSVMTFGGVNATNDPSGPAVPGTNGGIFKLLPNGRYSFDPTGLPDSVFLTDGSRFLTSVNYTVCITGANPPSPLCRQATLTVEVLYVVAEDDFDSTTWPTGVLVGTVSSNDYGTGGVTEVAKVVDRLTGTVHSIASGNPSVPVTGDNGGTFVLYSNGTYVFDASTVDPKDFPSDGSPLVTRVNYTACLPAPDGATCDPAVLSITVSYSISASDDSNKTPRTVPILPAASTSVLSNDSGSGPLSVMTFGGVNATNDPSGPAVPGTNGGIFKLLPNGRYSFDPTGLPDSVFPTDGSRFLTSVNYTVCITGANPPSPLCRQATLTVEVLYVVAENDFDSTWPTGVLVGTVSSNDYGTGGVTEVAKVVDRLTGTVHSIASGNPSVPVTGDNGGTFVLYSNGTYVFDASTVDPKDFPSDGSPLVTRVNYTACLPAPDGATCDPAVLSITVTYSISASDDSNKTPRTVPILPAASTSVLSNDSGPGPLSVMTFGGVNATNDPSGPAVPGTNGGIFKLLPNGRYSFDPTGLPDSVFPTDGSRFLTSVNYTVCITGANPPSPLCRQATLTVEVLYVVAEDDFDSTTWPTGVLMGTVSSNDYGTGGVTEVAKVVDRLTGTVHSIASGNPSVPVTGDNGGTFVLYSNGTYVFDASTVDPKDFPSDGSPLVTRVNYTACLPAPDGATCDPAVLSITVTYSISASDDSNKTPRTVPILPAASTSVLSNDSGSGPLSVMTFGGVNATNDPSGPAVPGTNGGIFKLLPNGRYSFDPTGLPDSVFPTDGSRFLTSVNYTVCITGANPPSPLCRQATLTVEVLYVVAEDDFDSTWPTGVLVGTVSSNDYGTGGVTEVAKVVDRLTGTVHSIASGNPSVPVTGDNGGTFVLYSNGTYVFNASTVDPKDFPSDGSPLVTRVNYTACLPAPDGATCDPAVLSITVTYSISASDDSNKTPRTVPILPAASTSVLSNDSGSGPLSVMTFGGVNATNDPSGPAVPGTNGGIFKLLPNGRYSFDPTGLPDSVFPTDGSRFLTSVNYTVCITGANPPSPLCRQATLTVEVLYVVAEDDFDSTWPTGVLVGTVSSNDYGTGGVTEVAKVVDRLTGTVHSIASGNPSVPVTGDNGGTFVLYSNGTYVFNASTVDPKDFPSDGSPLVTRVNYTACLPAPDGATCDPAVLSITVTYSISASDDSNKTPRTVPILPAASTSVLSNDSGSGPLSVMTFGGVNATNDPSGPAVPGTNGGIFKLLPNGRYSFDPTGLPDSVFLTDGSRFLTSVNYTVCITGANPPSPLCRQATLTVEVLYVVAEDDFDSTTWPTGVLMGTVSSNDYGTGGVTEVAKVVDRLTGTVHSIASGNPSVPVTGDNGGTFVLYSNGTYVFNASTVDPKDFPSDGSPLVTRVNYTACLPAPDGATCDPAVLSIIVSYSIFATDDFDTTVAKNPIINSTSLSVLDNDDGSGGLTVVSRTTASDNFPGCLFHFLADGTFDFDPSSCNITTPVKDQPTPVNVTYIVCLVSLDGIAPSLPSALCRTAVLTIYVQPDSDEESGGLSPSPSPPCPPCNCNEGGALIPPRSRSKQSSRNDSRDDQDSPDASDSPDSSDTSDGYDGPGRRDKKDGPGRRDEKDGPGRDKKALRSRPRSNQGKRHTKVRGKSDLRDVLDGGKPDRSKSKKRDSRDGKDSHKGKVNFAAIINDAKGFNDPCHCPCRLGMDLDRFGEWQYSDRGPDGKRRYLDRENLPRRPNEDEGAPLSRDKSSTLVVTSTLVSLSLASILAFSVYCRWRYIRRVSPHGPDSTALLKAGQRDLELEVSGEPAPAPSLGSDYGTLFDN
eukprot:g68785.t1